MPGDVLWGDVLLLVTFCGVMFCGVTFCGVTFCGVTFCRGTVLRLKGGSCYISPWPSCVIAMSTCHCTVLCTFVQIAYGS